MTDLPFSPAADRNKQPILDVLRTALGPGGTALEIASGTGQHAACFAAALPRWTWQPSEADEDMLPALARRVALAALPNLRPPLRLDVMEAPWPSKEAPFAHRLDAIYCANMLHIAPPATCGALMEGAARHLLAHGVLATYGPYFEAGPAAAGNLAFDRSLRARDPSWGIRSLDDVVQSAHESGLALLARHEMPANNLLLLFGIARDKRDRTR